MKLLDSHQTAYDKKKLIKNDLMFCLRNKHSNIVTVIDYGIYNGEEGSSPFYVMPFYQGNLRTLIIAGIVPNKVLPYFSQLLDGIEAAHLQTLLHLDIKPENILYDKKADRLSVCDFGIAHFEDDKLYATPETDRLSNFQYSAPEQLSHSGEADTRSDIYSLGLILNEMFTHEVPYGTDFRTIGSIAPEYAYLDDLVSEMIRQAPGDRPASISAIKTALIGRRNEFITQQRLSKLNDTVIRVTDIDDPLIANPPKVIGFDYVSGKLILTLSQVVNPTWLSAFKNMEQFSYPVGYHPVRFFISENKAVVRADEWIIQELIDYFNGWLRIATREYKEIIEQTINDEEKMKREELYEEIEECERHLRVLNTVKLVNCIG